ncbi:MAG: WGxxGxxG-CTERM domain-containing protein [Acidobacteriota bacterium]|nr:WGxxGxxG-CTERM domain-containing protein [Acidobacteriota bacterium]
MTASAQTNTNGNYSAGTTQTTRTVERDDNTDWGWLGLLGLAGLAGLLKKPKQVVVDRTTDTTNRPRT